MVFSPRNQGAQVGYCVFDSFSTPRSLLSMPTPVLLNIPFSHSTVHTTNSKVQTLQHKASEWSGVQTSDAFAIDDTNLFQKLGLQSFLNLSTEFYNRLYDDEEEWFRSIFADSKKEDAIQNQYEFFVRRRGGPPLYSRKRGHPALIARHRPFPVMHQAAERWLHHTQHALDSTSDIDDDSKIKMINFFRHNCIFSGGRR